MQTLEHVRASIKRWRSRARRAQTALDKLYRQEARLLRNPAVPPAEPAPVVEPVAPPPPVLSPGNTDYDALLAHVEDQLSIPPFLQRAPAGVARKSPLTPEGEAELVKAAEVKKTKARGRIAKLKAKQSGATRKMPLEGKAALAFIKGA